MGEGFPTREAALVAAGRTFGQSLDLQTTLESIARELTGTLADWCVIDLLDEEGHIRRKVVRSSDGAPEKLERDMMAWAPDPWMPRGVQRVIETRQPVHYPKVTEEHIARAARGPGHAEMMRELGMTSYLCLPLLIEGRAIGTLMLFTTRSLRSYGSAETAWLGEIADRAALAIDHAARYTQQQQQLAQQNEVLSMVCHDLGNPLGTILVSASVLLAGAPGDERRRLGRPQLELIQRAARSMGGLLRGLTEASCAEGLSGARVFDVRILITEACALLRPQAQGRSITLAQRPEPNPLWVWCDPPKVQQALANLLGNAVKFTQEGGAVTVEATRSPDGEHVNLAVRDTGRGIAHDDLPRVFDRGWQAPATSVRGHGLGLWITRKIVEAHGGRVWVESAPGAGSTFWFNLPVGLSSAQRRETQTAIDAAK